MSAPTIEVAKAFSHPLRYRIMRYLWSEVDGGVASPTAMAEEFAEPLGNVSYHVKTLLGLGMIDLFETKPRRGALEHFYELSDAGKAAMRP